MEKFPKKILGRNFGEIVEDISEIMFPIVLREIHERTSVRNAGGILEESSDEHFKEILAKF